MNTKSIIAAGLLGSLALAVQASAAPGGPAQRFGKVLWRRRRRQE